MEQRRILVVDDEESIRFTFESFLTDEGYEVETACGYDEGQALIRERPFDLIFIDIILDGGKSGIVLLELVRDRAPETEVIIITGAPSVKTASAALRLGALDYMVKPVRQDALIRATEMALKHQTLRREKESYQQNLEAIFRSVQDAIITVDEKLTVVETNRAAAEICGIDRNEVAGKALDSLEVACGGACLKTLRETVLGGKRIDVGARRLRFARPAGSGGFGHRDAAHAEEPHTIRRSPGDSQRDSYRRTRTQSRRVP